MANRAVWLLSRLFVLAESWEMVPRDRNPSRHIRYYREKSCERFLTPEEVRRVGAALQKFGAIGSMQASTIVALRLLMPISCRTGEILSLRWDDVDRTAKVLRERDGKTGPCMVPLSGPVLTVLESIERIEGVPYVIRNKSGCRLTSLSLRWQRIRKEAELDDVRVHDLRHSCASRALAFGESLTVIGRLPGHAKAEPTTCDNTTPLGIETLDHLELPGTRLVRMDLVLRGDLVRRPLAPKRIQRRFALSSPENLRRLPRICIPPSSGEIHLRGRFERG